MRPPSKTLYAAGTPVPIGLWPYDSLETGEAFDQGTADPFGNLGDIDLDAEDEQD